MRRKEIKKLLREYKIAPKKSLGQNFLLNFYVLKKIAKNLGAEDVDIIVEVGSGLGFLTEILAKEAKKVVAIEKDKKLSEILKEKLRNFKNVKVLNIDVLKFSPKEFLGKKSYKVVGNLPYNIATATIRHFLEIEVQPKEMIFLIQKEVAQKISAKKSSLLKLSIEFYAKPKILFYVKKEYFFPKPKVDGAVIKIYDIKRGIPGIDRDLFFKIVKAGFSHPRKTILNNLSEGLKLEKREGRYFLTRTGIFHSKRPENLSIKNWFNVYYVFSKKRFK
ncbi:MAG: 16S rRNA (adenine(1518)-N(6)/adenine(1519)-N(6))-dimethyltransferase RsmA [Candidatus Pacebacteria bacterium]|nr:16S rRNA (adenine(1518)-N(6)/adenine(1519)-N(6))-dimethyltransferase RsmA [Candidatus Paceibacterota bacterium]